MPVDEEMKGEENEPELGAGVHPDLDHRDARADGVRARLLIAV